MPRKLRPLDTLQLAYSDTFVALRPLTPSNLGRAVPIVAQERGGELVLSIYNYFQGAAKRFWEYATLRGPFYKGNIRAGFAIEVVDHAEFGEFAAFRVHIARGHVADRMDPTAVQSAAGELRRWVEAIHRPGARLAPGRRRPPGVSNLLAR